MRGIKKIILTLFFMTLIGVGFNIDVKAAKLKLTPPGDGSPSILYSDQDWSNDDAKLISSILELAVSDFPVIKDGQDYVSGNLPEASFVYKTAIIDTASSAVTTTQKIGKPITLKLKSVKNMDDDGSVDVYDYFVVYQVEGENPVEIEITDDISKEYELSSVARDDVRDGVRDNFGQEDNERYVKVHYVANFDGIEKSNLKEGLDVITNNPPDITSSGDNAFQIAQITATAYVNPDSKSVVPGVSIKGAGEFLLPRQSTTLTIEQEPNDKNLKFVRWSYNNLSDEAIAGSSKDGCPVTMSRNALAQTINLWYGSLSIPDLTVDKMTVLPYVDSDPLDRDYVTYNFPRDIQGEGGGVYFAPEETDNYKAVTSYDFNYKNKGQFSFKVRRDTPNGKYKLKITTNNNSGNQDYIFGFTVGSSPTEQWTITFDKNGGSGTMEPQTVNKGATATLKENTFTRSGYTFKSWNTKKDGSGTSYADKDNITPTDDLTLYAQWDTSPTPTPGSTIMVTRGEMVLLHKDYKIPGVPTDYTNHITVKQSGSDYEIWGSKLTTSSKKGSITVSGKTYDVEVYDRPDLIWDFSTTSSSSTLTIEMPSSVYNDDGETFWDLDDVDVAAIIVSGQRRGTSKGWSYPLSGSGTTRTRKITLTELNSMINQVASGSEDIITIDLYPVDPYTGAIDYDVSDSESFTVYKVELDGSHGATYKVNDKEVGDSFYAIDGVEYKISASNKSGYSSTIEKWEGVNFGTSTSGSTSFYGSKRIAAYFKSNTTTSSSSSSSSARSSSSSSSGRTTAPGGGTGGDYDDVPKTGESKTDIWILWSVLFISILGAGFMIYKRFGLVKAIARAEEEAALVEREERVEAEKKEKKEKMDLLKSLRDL